LEIDAMRLLALAFVLPAACGGASPAAVSVQAVFDHYGAMAYAAYADSVTKAIALRTALEEFLGAPSARTLESAKAAWIAAREPYSQTETLRFYGGPIDDDATGPEGRINAWPLDESFIDYVEGNADAGIINDLVQYPAITRDVILNADQSGGETTISTGFHAIEFLLWGQDRDPAGPGRRPHTDYLVGAGGTAQNAARRAEYLRAVASLLVDDLTAVRDAWAPNVPGNYRAQFNALPATEGLRRILTGMGTLSGAELSHERMQVAYDTKDQEDEHSCFSDTTHNDHRLAAAGMQNVYLGRYGALAGTSLSDLVKSRNPALDAAMRAALAATQEAIAAIPVPFDQAIVGADTSPGRVKVKAAVDALKSQTRITVDIATALGVTLNF
jgi:putative iron-regulated protein